MQNGFKEAEDNVTAATTLLGWGSGMFPLKLCAHRLVSSRFGRTFSLFSNGELVTFFVLELYENVLQYKVSPLSGVGSNPIP